MARSLGLNSINRKQMDEFDLSVWTVRLSPALKRYFTRRVDVNEVDDLVQEVLVCIQKVKEKKRIEDPERYIFTAARNILVNHYRRSKVRFSKFHDPLDETIELPDHLSPERIAIGKQEYERAISAIQNLPPRARTAFQLHRFEHMTYKQIALHMGISKESVKELMHRAILRIAKEMESDK